MPNLNEEQRRRSIRGGFGERRVTVAEVVFPNSPPYFFLLRNRRLYTAYNYLLSDYLYTLSVVKKISEAV